MKWTTVILIAVTAVLFVACPEIADGAPSNVMEHEFSVENNTGKNLTVSLTPLNYTPENGAWDDSTMSVPLAYWLPPEEKDITTGNSEILVLKQMRWSTHIDGKWYDRWTTFAIEISGDDGEYTIAGYPDDSSGKTHFSAIYSEPDNTFVAGSPDMYGAGYALLQGDPPKTNNILHSSLAVGSAVPHGERMLTSRVRYTITVNDLTTASADVTVDCAEISDLIFNP